MSSCPHLLLQVSKVICDSKDTLLSHFSPPKLSEKLIYKIYLMLHTHTKKPTKENINNKKIYKVISAKILACRDQLKILDLWSRYSSIYLSGEAAAH